MPNPNGENGAVEAERAEVAALLGSTFFARAHSLRRLLEFLASAYFEGARADLTEHDVAVGVRGDAAAFDPRQDSVVRVETHRLRKKLKSYYETDGADHALELMLDPGQYMPRFVARTREPAAEPEAAPQAVPAIWLPPAPLPLAPAPLPPAPQTRSRGPSGRVGLAVAAGLLLSMAGLPGHVPSSEGRRPSADLRLMAGCAAGPVLDPLGQTWLADRYHRGGQEAALVPEAHHPLATLRSGDFDYEIPLPDRPHELHLHFWRGPEIAATRRFHVFANGTLLMDDLEPAAQIPAKEPVVRAFRDILPARDGKLHLTFRGGADPAFVNGIEISAGDKGRMCTIRYVAAGAPHVDAGGKLWRAERYVAGGSLMPREEPVSGPFDPNLFSSERYGEFIYAIPVPAGRYRLTLYFAETWFGPGHPGGGGAGSRRFDVLVNGVPKLRDFDIFKEAGGSYRSIARVFQDLEPGPDGTIRIAFRSLVNRGCVNALELADMKPRAR
jgi:hypothetical protein